MHSPGLVGVLETALYHETAERDAIERFYGDVLGLPAVAGWDDGVAFRVGGGVLLLFDREQLALRAGPIADHATHGAGHACLLARGSDDLERWRELLEAAGVEILYDHDWGERRSFYFKDPAANLLEIADGDLWPPR
jgi:catechol 2,3-dioxygenase-like lactoylglutathione lyase family enzyme